MSRNLSELSFRKGLKDNLFTAIANAKVDGVISREKVLEIADNYLVGKASVYCTSTFYDFSSEANKGKRAYVCNGSACRLKGSQNEVKSHLLEHLDEEEIGSMTCLGRCYENSAFNFDGKNYSNLSKREIDDLFQGKTVEQRGYDVGYFKHRLLTADAQNVKELYSVLDFVYSLSPQEVVDEIKKSALRGRGGAGFPIGIKLESCANEVSDDKFIICNADEGDPGAFTDRYLLEEQPHFVLLGMMLAGYAVGARHGVLYIRAEYPEAISIIEKEIERLSSIGITGSDKFEFYVIKAQGAYICGEETALINSIEGQRPEVRVRPPFPTQKGLFNRPTVVNNVETLASLPYILKNGWGNFIELGTKKSTGTKLVSLDSFFNNPGVYEVPMGTPLAFVVNELGGGFSESIKALHIGGPLGGIVPVSMIDKLKIEFESFAENGFLLGHASIVCIPRNYSLVEYAKHLFEFAAHESCGKCFPCRIGSTRGAEMLQNATKGNGLDEELFDDLLETLELGSLCALGGGLPLPIRNMMEYFEDEFKF